MEGLEEFALPAGPGRDWHRVLRDQGQRYYLEPTPGGPLVRVVRDGAGNWFSEDMDRAWDAEGFARHFEPIPDWALPDSEPDPEPDKGKGKRKRKERPPRADSGRMLIQVTNGQLPLVVDQAEQALISTGAGLYQHGTRLVRMASWDASALPKQAIVKRETGAAVLFEIQPHWLTERLCKAADWEKWDVRNNDWITIDAPRRVADHLLSRQGEWRFPHLTGFCESPTLSPAGTVIDRPGYDSDTGLYLTHSLDMRPLALRADELREDARWAAEFLSELIETFPFVAACDRSAALAMLMTAVLRRVLPAAPLVGVSASTPSTGKSLLANCAAVLATGREASVLGIGDTEIETEKRVDACLLDGDGVVLVDNVSRAVRSDVLCQVATQSWKTVRVLGASRKVECPTNVLWMLTGNNLTLLGDLTSRTLMIRLEAGCERPEEREFQRDALEHVLANRAEAVRAVLTLSKAYLDAGAPRVDGGSATRFAAWDRMVRRPLLWAGLPDPWTTARTLREDDHELVAMGDLLSAWHAWCGSRPVTAQELYGAAREVVPQFGGPPIPALPDLAEAMVTIIDDSARGGGARALGYRLRAHRGRIFGKFLIEQEKGKTRAGIRWVCRAL